jgi:gliding motility-associated protein GldE
MPLMAFNTSILLLGLLLVLLITASSLVSSSEVAYFSLTPTDLSEISDTGDDTGDRIVSLLRRPNYLLATILISNNLVNIAIILVLARFLNLLIPDTAYQSAGAFINQYPPFSYFSTETSTNFIELFITVGLVTFILVLFGEVIPKVYAQLNRVGVARFNSRLLSILSKLTLPLSAILVNSTSILENRFFENSNNKQTSMEDIDEAIDLAVGDDESSIEEKGILRGIIKFGDVPVKQITKSYVDVVSVDFKDKYDVLMQTAKDSGYSRIPIIDESFDNVTGILYVKDLLPYLNEGSDFEWQSMIRTDVFYVPEAKKLDDLLEDFQKQKQHIAIVVDEFGGSSGIVTLEDVIEEVIGDIKDEFDEDGEIEYKKIDELNYLFEGKTLINDMNRVISAPPEHFDDQRGDADSLAGLVLELSGYIPRVGEIFDSNGYFFKVVTVNKRRIEQILVTLPTSNEDNNV